MTVFHKFYKILRSKYQVFTLYTVYNVIFLPLYNHFHQNMTVLQHFLPQTPHKEFRSDF